MTNGGGHYYYSPPRRFPKGVDVNSDLLINVGKEIENNEDINFLFSKGLDPKQFLRLYLPSREAIRSCYGTFVSKLISLKINRWQDNSNTSVLYKRTKCLRTTIYFTFEDRNIMQEIFNDETFQEILSVFDSPI